MYAYLKRSPPRLGFLVFCLLIGFSASLLARIPENFTAQLLESHTDYTDQAIAGTWDKLSHRIGVQPFNFIALALFICAIVHTFFAHKITVLAHKTHDNFVAAHRVRLASASPDDPIHRYGDNPVSFKAEILRFLGEVEVIFLIWVIPLVGFLTYWFDWNEAIHYLNTRNYTEPLFVIVIMTVASTRPVIVFAEKCLEWVAKAGGKKPSAWWFSILTVGPLLGSFITEPAAMTISAYILGRRFYRYKPSRSFAYATLGLLFVNVSVGGVLTHFAAPPVLMVQYQWHWDTLYMLSHFGWKSALGILVSTSCYFLYFRKELQNLNAKSGSEALESGRDHKVPLWITVAHLLFLAWIVLNNHYPVVFIGSFLLFLGFHQATSPHQHYLTLKPPLLVGCFLTGLVIHGGLQGWWIAPILEGIADSLLIKVAMVLTAFNDNAAITYLTTLIPNFAENLKYAVVAGAVVGGGLTVIANAPNPAGQSILSKHFEDGIAPAGLFLGALFPTLIMYLSFALF